jgi:hypothetical protein
MRSDLIDVNGSLKKTALGETRTMPAPDADARRRLRSGLEIVGDAVVTSAVENDHHVFWRDRIGTGDRKGIGRGGGEPLELRHQAVVARKDLLEQRMSLGVGDADQASGEAWILRQRKPRLHPIHWAEVKSGAGEFAAAHAFHLDLETGSAGPFLVERADRRGERHRQGEDCGGESDLSSHLASRLVSSVHPAADDGISVWPR